MIRYTGWQKKQKKKIVEEEHLMKVYALDENKSDFEKVLIMTEKIRGLAEAKKLCSRILNDDTFDREENIKGLSDEAKERYMSI